MSDEAVQESPLCSGTQERAAHKRSLSAPPRMTESGPVVRARAMSFTADLREPLVVTDAVTATTPMGQSGAMRGALKTPTAAPLESRCSMSYEALSTVSPQHFAAHGAFSPLQSPVPLTPLQPASQWDERTCGAGTGPVSPACEPATVFADQAPCCAPLGIQHYGPFGSDLQQQQVSYAEPQQQVSYAEPQLQQQQVSYAEPQLQQHPCVHWGHLPALHEQQPVDVWQRVGQTCEHIRGLLQQPADQGLQESWLACMQQQFEQLRSFDGELRGILEPHVQALLSTTFQQPCGGDTWAHLRDPQYIESMHHLVGELLVLQPPPLPPPPPPQEWWQQPDHGLGRQPWPPQPPPPPPQEWWQQPAPPPQQWREIEGQQGSAAQRPERRQARRQRRQEKKRPAPVRVHPSVRHPPPSAAVVPLSPRPLTDKERMEAARRAQRRLFAKERKAGICPV